MSQSTFVIFVAAAALAAALAGAFAGADRRVFLPAPPEGSHARFEAACEACHEPWRGPADEMCLKCHERSVSGGPHSAAKLREPERASIPPELSKVTCVTCHREHVPGRPDGYTGPPDLCVECHRTENVDTAHVDFEPGSCRTASCHSYHSGVGGKELLSAPDTRIKSAADLPEKPAGRGENSRLDPESIKRLRDDVFFKGNKAQAARYEISAHYGTRATCRRCHEAGRRRIDLKPPVEVCSECHEGQVKGFGEGRHGAAAALGVERFIARDRRVGCGSCHDVHSLRLERAGREACLGCHHSRHAESYEKSGHNRYLTDPVYKDKPMTGVDCAGCHMPRLEENDGYTEHNETLTSSSIEKMARIVCSRCHGLKFSLWSLYDKEVVESCFTYSPSGPLPAGMGYSLYGGANP